MDPINQTAEALAALSGIVIILMIIVQVFIFLFTASVAADKNRGGARWFFISVLSAMCTFGILSWIPLMLLVLSDRKEPT